MINDVTGIASQRIVRILVAKVASAPPPVVTQLHVPVEMVFATTVPMHPEKWMSSTYHRRRNETLYYPIRTANPRQTIVEKRQKTAPGSFL
jgi:hypothetical protein